VTAKDLDDPVESFAVTAIAHIQRGRPQPKAPFQPRQDADQRLRRRLSRRASLRG
jgi:hypothetical protein